MRDAAVKDARLGQLARLCSTGLLRLAGIPSAGQAQRKKLVQQNKTPAQANEWPVGGYPLLIAGIVLPLQFKSCGENIPFRRAQSHPRMPMHVAGELGRIVPAKVLEIEKDKPAGRATKGVVKAEVGR